MKFLIKIILVISFFSCHSEDNRLKVKNNTLKPIIIKMLSDKEMEGVYIDVFRTSSFKVLSKKEDNFTLVYSKWEYEFKDILPDSLINVVIFRDFKFKSIEKGMKAYRKRDSLFKKNKKAYKKYSLKELIKNDWLITYPDDGFIEY